MTTPPIPIAIVGTLLGLAWLVALAAFVVILALHGRQEERARAKSPGVAAATPRADSPTATPGPSDWRKFGVGPASEQDA